MLAALRNIGIISHIDAGKTTVSERILYCTGEIRRLGEVHDGNATMDWMAQEQERGITITATCTTCRWRDVIINLIDTPGHIDFTIEVERSLRVLDGAVVIFSAVEGVQPQSESVWRQADRYRVPRLCLINKLDRLGADPARVLDEIRQRLKARPIALQLPVGVEERFTGVVDLIDQTLLTYSGDPLPPRSSAIPPEYAEAAAAARSALLEAAADCDDDLLAAFLDERPLAPAQIRAALRRGTLAGRIVPVVYAAALRNKGIEPLLDAVADYLPSPLDRPPAPARRPDGTAAAVAPEDETLCALAFKVVADEGRKLAYLRIYSGSLTSGDVVLNAATGVRERIGRIVRMHASRREASEKLAAGEIGAVSGLRSVLTGDTLSAPAQPLILAGLELPEPVVSLAIEAYGVDDREKFLPALERLLWEDPSLQLRDDPETGQTLLSGMGELHLEIALDRLQREHGVRVRSGPPRVMYRETIGRTIERCETYERESDGRLLAGEVCLRLRPLPSGSGLQIPPLPETVGLGVEARQNLTLDLSRAATAGPLAGYPLTDLEIAIVAIPFIPGISSEAGVRAALQRGLALALQEATPRLLEPLMRLEVTVPAEAAGRVLASLQKKQGRISGLIARDREEILEAEVPLSELFGFTTELRSLTRGHGAFSMEFSRFETIPEARRQRPGRF